MFDPTKPIVTLTEAATGHVHRLMARADNDVIGLRVGVKTAGCSGMQYVQRKLQRSVTDIRK